MRHGCITITPFTMEKKSQDLVTSSNTEQTNMVYGGQPFHELKKDARKKKGWIKFRSSLLDFKLKISI